MAKRSKVKIPKIELKPFDSSKIKPTVIDDGKVSFNFWRLFEKPKKFKYSVCESKYFKKVLERLKNISNLSRMELCTTCSKSLRSHAIDFNHKSVTENTFGFGEDIDDEAWQFEVSENEHGRIHGYFVGNVFYIVWLDPKHDLYR